MITGERSFLSFSVGESVVVSKGDLRTTGKILRRKPEARMYLVDLYSSDVCSWYHESQLMTLNDANQDRIARLPD